MFAASELLDFAFASDKARGAREGRTNAGGVDKVDTSVDKVDTGDLGGEESEGGPHKWGMPPLTRLTRAQDSHIGDLWCWLLEQQ